MTDYFQPHSCKEALSALKQNPGCTIVAGGTDVLTDHYKKNEEFDRILDLGKVTELKKIKEEETEISIGAGVTFRMLESDDIVEKYLPLLSHAASVVGSPQIRSKGTIGGNLCNANPAADTVPALIALRAVLVLSSESQERRVPAEAFITGRGQTILENDELLTRIIVKKPSDHVICRFEKVGRRNALAIARISIALNMETDGSVMKALHLAIGAVSSKPFDFQCICGRAEGCSLKAFDPEAIVGPVTEEVKKSTEGRNSAEYKVPVLRDLLRRMLQSVICEAEKEES